MSGAAMTKGRHSVRFLIGFVCFFEAVLFLSPLPIHAGGKRDIKTVTLDGQEIWQAEFDISRLRIGKHNIIVRARDPAGNITEDGPYNIRVDPRAGLPLARIVYPENNSVIRSDVSVVGVASGRFGVDRVLLRVDGGAQEELEGKDYWSRHFVGEDALAEGKHTIAAQSFDLKSTAGPVSQISFVVDRTPPALEVLSHKTGDFVRGNITVSGYASDINGIETLEISTDGGDEFRPLPFRKKWGKGDTVDFSFRVKTKDFLDGSLLYIIRAADTTGLTTTQSYLFFVDNNGPELDIISPKIDEAVWDTIRVTGSLFDAVGIDRFYYEWNGQQVDIPIYPGDPYWAVEIFVPYRARL